MELITPELFKNFFRKRMPGAHKGDFGHALIIAGSTGKIGAGWLASRAALRAGAGLVTFALPEAAFAKFDPAAAEVMVEPVADKKRGCFCVESIDTIKKLCQGKSAVGFGPGIGTKEETAQASIELISRINLPLVIDADALNNLAGNLKILSKRKAPTALTPHPGEMARLTGLDKKVIAANRVGIAKEFAVKYGVYLVLKGFRSIVAAPDGKIFINPTGNPAMATAGMGDALTGIITAFIGMKIPVEKAVIAGVYIHGMAGDIASETIGETGLIASDLIAKIPAAITVVRHWNGNQSPL